MSYFEAYQTVWEFHKKYNSMDDTDEDWEAVIDEANQICKRFDNNLFVRGLLMAVLDELERKCKEMRKYADRRV